MPENTRRFSVSKRFFVAGIVILFLASIAAFLVQTDFGNITIKQLELVTDQGNKIAAMIYLPSGASEENPAPAVLAVHGGNSSRYAVSNFAQEFARRGYVVVSIDQSYNAQSDRGENNFYGEEAAMKYITTLKFVDQSRLGVMGHSMGNSVVNMIEANPQFGVRAGITLGAGTTVAPDTAVNVCVLIGTQDENTGPRGTDIRVRGPIDAGKSAGLLAAFGLPETDEIVCGQEYGSREDNTLRVMYQPTCGHLGILYSSEAISIALNFMSDILGVKYSLDAGSQLWFVREIACAAAYVALFLVAFGAIGILLDRRRDTLSLEQSAQGHASANAGYWAGLVLMCLIPAVAIQDLYTVGKIFFTSISQNIFAMEHINGVIFWMLCTAVAILAVNLIVKKLTKGYDWGFDRDVLCIQPRVLIRYFSIACVTVLTLYVLVYLTSFFFDINIRFINTEVHLFTRTRFGVFWAYLPLYLLYYVIIGYVQITGLLCKGQSVLSQYLRTLVVSVVGPAAVLAAWYGTCIFTGINYFFEWRFVLGVLFNFLPGMIVGSIIQVYCYRRTGKIWLGALINSLIFAWMATSIGVMLPTV